LKRKFIKDKKGIVLLDSKEKFNEDYGFSPDLGDTFHQLFYMLYVIFGIRPHVASLGSLRYNPGHKTEVHKINNIFDAIRSRI
jgi:hypothetical protein